MPKRKQDFNTIYISERLQEALRPISRCALTAVVAPMGYGKTTAVNWYLAERGKEENARIIRISVYSDNLAIFWKSVQDAFLRAGLSILLDYPCPTDAAGGSLLSDDLCHALAGEKPCYLFIDDFHLLTDKRAPLFLCMLANRLPANVHVIVASRDRFLPAAEAVRLGGKVYQIGMEQLRLNHTELAVNAHRCGTKLSDAQVESLLYSSEGWFSAVYLNLHALAERGSLLQPGPDIYAMFTAAMLESLPEKTRGFLAVMWLADEFTVEMARAVTALPDAEEVLRALTQQNAFVTRLPDGVSFRFHHMMKDCAERTFHTMEPRRQAVYHNRYGEWYKTHGQYLHALKFYCLAKNYDAALRVIQRDAGILLTSLGAQQVLDFIAHCPGETLKEHPLSLLVLMRSMFNWRQIPKMLELKELLLAAITEHPDWPESERGDLLGECDLIMSFLMYNDISAMSRLHRSASAQMSRPAISIQKSGGWTFGSPSVLMMFYRASGELQSELTEMDECMPHYYKITNGHGQGAETIMRAEADFMRACFADAQIMLERAYAQIDGNGQENMALCCDFLAWRLSLCTSFTPRESFEQRREALLGLHSVTWLNILQSSCAYYYALLCQPEKIPAVFREHQLASIHFLAPGKPMMELIENQVYLAQGEYAKVIGRSEALLGMCEAMHYALVALHIRLQTAAAYEMLGKRETADELLISALAAAEPDALYLPFVENYRYLKTALTRGAGAKFAAFVRTVTPLGEDFVRRCGEKRAEGSRPAALAGLTERESAIAALVAKRLSNREIAEQLFLSEGSVKQYINQIYSKLLITGDVRTKRKRLAELAAPKS